MFSQRIAQSTIDRIFELNSATEYIVGAGVLLVSVFAIKLVNRILTRKLEKINHEWSGYLRQMVNYAWPLLYVLIFFLIFNYYTVPEKVDQIATYAFKVAFILLVIRLIVAALRAAIYSYLRHHDDTGEKVKQVRGIVLILSAVVWLLGLIFMFDNLGFNVTAVLTGLGVGGIAIALAAQTILGDLFNYFVIFFDRPFEIGDFIIVDDKMGTVEYIGLKTTRVRSLQGEQIVFSNTNLTNSRIHNYKRMNERRILFKLTVIYETSHENLQAIPALIREAVEQQPDTRFDRAHFASFGDYSLNFEVVYYILSADYNRYMDIQQQINLQIFKTFSDQGIEFAYPTYAITSKSQNNDHPAKPPALVPLNRNELAYK